MKTLNDQFKVWKKQNTPQPYKQEERLTEREWKELMGMDQQRLSRGKGGAYRHKIRGRFY
ncbi:hypothetical protein QUF79_14990 [Fictibacillus enclensis]|uniref:hypothetical protein n=1 Tax=Fictibacillus enclensis TaxID=1017270 RepID=UPI0025A2295F|nr:hypothetical protein [Fictibacillus enclensis]MDM5199324.1 hypothetical protein [Fictibacillus enclensis]